MSSNNNQRKPSSPTKPATPFTPCSFELVNSVSSNDDPKITIPVKKYVSKRTGMRLYACEIKGPVIEGKHV